MSFNRDHLLNLPVDEKLELVEALWDSIDEDTIGKKFSKQQLEEELDRRMQNAIDNPQSLISWKDVRARMKM